MSTNAKPAPLQIALQMDPPSSINPNGDSSFAMGLEAMARGYQLFYYAPTSLNFDGNGLSAYIYPLEFMRPTNADADFFRMGEGARRPLAEMDVVLIRQDPPFDMGYLTTTWLLEHVMNDCLLVNNPISIRDCPEKLLITHFPDLIPPTLISRDEGDITAFFTEYQDIIIKPLYGNGGFGIFHLQKGDENLSSLLELFFSTSREPIMAQAYLPAVRQGDKRILIADGKLCGAINRIPADGQARSNMHVGGKAAAVELTSRDHEIVERIGPTLREKGLIFTGIDVIGTYLTEINVTSPTGLQEAERFQRLAGDTGPSPTALLWDAIEARL